MPPRRLRLPTAPGVTLVVDGRDVEAFEGEPVAHAILASGRWVFGRSVKYHRARGPVCVGGRCEGCLLRIDGVPSVMSCRTPATHGLRCDAQNVVGSAEHDLLAVTDLVFPGGLDHHEMFTWSKPVNRSMQIVARHIAGVGTLPDEREEAIEVERLETDVLVVGAGRAGLTVASVCAAAGLGTLVLEEERAVQADVASLGARAIAAGADVRLGRTVVGVFPETGERRVVLADASFGDGGAMSIAPSVVVIATGSAEMGALFPGNDLPGIVNASGAERLLDAGILVGETIVLAAHPEERERAAPLAARLREAGATVTEIDEGEIRGAKGRTGVREVQTASGVMRCDALVLASLRAPVIELAQQAGAKAHFSGERFVVACSALDGSTAHPGTFVVGSAASVEDDVVAHAERAATAIVVRLRAEVAHG